MYHTAVRALRNAGLAHRIPNFELTCDPVVKFEMTETAGGNAGRTRFGGSPDLPPSAKWPLHGSQPLAFLAQFDLGHMRGFRALSDLPPRGLLQFFYNNEEQPWGYDPGHRGGCAVLYHPDTSVLLPRIAPNNPETTVFPARFIKAADELMSPGFGDDDLRAAGFSEDEIDVFNEAWEEENTCRCSGRPCSCDPFVRTTDQIFGHPFCLQGDDMDLECQLVSNGFYCGDERGYMDPRAQEHRARAKDWRLLFQIGSDDTLDMVWGGHGYLYFWIRRQDLKNLNFSNVWVILQCT